MNRSLRQRLARFAVVAWLALFALALLPSITRIANATTAGGWSEVCTAQGMKWLTPDGSLSERGPLGQTGQHGAHCLLCGGAAPALPPSPIAPLAVAADTPFEPPLFLHAPTRLFAWSSAQPRAPPIVS